MVVVDWTMLSPTRTLINVFEAVFRQSDRSSFSSSNAFDL
jgi:hypothetical protein